MQKINIIQFLPYFPPHKGWLENVSLEFSTDYVKKWFWDIINVVFDIDQNYDIWETTLKDDNNLDIWYIKNWFKVYLLPSFEIVNNFPFPKFWKKKFWKVLSCIKTSIINKNDNFLVQTHTRFFISSFLWWIFSKNNNLKWVHIEHWSDYVKLWSKIKSTIAYIYDKLIWMWIFKNATHIIAISNWVKKFITTEFIKDRNIDVIYNWINFNSWNKIVNWDKIVIWFIWRLVKLKWVDLLLDAFETLSSKYPNLFLEILWDWEEKSNLINIVKSNKIKNVVFLWFKDREYIANEFLPKIDILVNPSFQEWLPTSILEWLISWCVVVATDVWWTKEISNKDDLIIVKKWDVNSLKKWIDKAINSYKKNSWLSKKSIKETFDWNNNIEKYFNLYKSLK